MIYWNNFHMQSKDEKVKSHCRNSSLLMGYRSTYSDEEKTIGKPGSNYKISEELSCSIWYIIVRSSSKKLKQETTGFNYQKMDLSGLEEKFPDNKSCSTVHIMLWLQVIEQRFRWPSVRDIADIPNWAHTFYHSISV